MDEYISRQEAINALHEVYEHEYPTASGDFDEYARHDVRNVLNGLPAYGTITHEQFAEAAKQLMEEFTANDGYGTSASATFLALCFGNLELRLFGTDGDKEEIK